MIIRLGYELAYEFEQPTPMILMLGIHSSRIADILIQDNMTTSPSVNLQGFWDSYGNWCNRILAPAGNFTVSTDALIKDSGEPEVIKTSGQQWDVSKLPSEALHFLLGSRYCETDLLNEIAWELFEKEAPGIDRVIAISNYVHSHIEFGNEYARSTRTAYEAFDEGKGVCRDYAHLAITFCRCMNIPARYCTGYLGDLQMPSASTPSAFTAWMEVFIDGGWHVFDPRHNEPKTGRVLIARGRDAADVSISSTFGPSELKKFAVWAEEVDVETISEFEEGYMKHKFFKPSCRVMSADYVNK